MVIFAFLQQYKKTKHNNQELYSNLILAGKILDSRLIRVTLEIEVFLAQIC